SGGPWITPELSMQELVWSETKIDGGKPIELQLAEPESRGGFYRDIAVLAIPTLNSGFRLMNWPAKIGRRTSPGDRAKATTREARPAAAGDVIPLDKVILLQEKTDAAGKLRWDAPPGQWTVLRFGHTS